MQRRDLSKVLIASAAGVTFPGHQLAGKTGTDVGYQRSPAEVALGLTPSDTRYLPGNVLRYGADPAGMRDSAPAFLSAQRVATQTGVELLIPGGTYRAEATLEWGFASLHVRAAGNVTIFFTKPGPCVTIDGGASGPGIYGVRVSGYLRLVGNKATTDAWFVQACHHSELQLRAADCATALRTKWCVLTKFEITCSSNEGRFLAQVPRAGVVADQRQRGETTAACTFKVPTLEGIAGIGIDLLATLQCVFVGGSSESNQVGIRQANANNVGNTFIGFDLESNTAQDVIIAGGSNITFININSMSQVGAPNIDLAGGDNTTFIGGYLRCLNVQARSTGTVLFASQVADSWRLGIRGPGPVTTFGVQKVDGSRAVTGKVSATGDFAACAPAIQSAIDASVKATQTPGAAPPDYVPPNSS